MWIILSRVWPYLTAVALVLGLGVWVFSLGSRYGAQAVQVKWNAERAERDETLRLLKAQYDAMESIHRAEQTRITHELSKANKQFEVARATAWADYIDRMRNSEARRGTYERQTQDGSLECRAIGSHAAQLDKSLEEGRGLVQELGDTLRLRDSQLIMVGNQLLNDRKLQQPENANDR